MKIISNVCEVCRQLPKKFYYNEIERTDGSPNFTGYYFIINRLDDSALVLMSNGQFARQIQTRPTFQIHPALQHLCRSCYEKIYHFELFENEDLEDEGECDTGHMF